MMEGRCPDAFYCSDGSHGYSVIKPTLLIMPAYIALLFSLLSCLGALLTLIAYCAFKDMRKGTTQTIVTLLALADLGTAISGIFGACLFIGYDYSVQKSEKECCIFDTACQIQGFMSFCSQFCGFIWSSLLAIHLFLITSFKHSTWVTKLLPLYNIVAWMVPLALALPLLILNEFGFIPESKWTCFLWWNSYAITVYLWWALELFVTAVTLIGFTVILVYVSCKQTCWLGHTAVQRVNKRIFVILVAYIILRMPDTIQIISSSFNGRQACSDDRTQIYVFITTTLEALTDTSQGWVNCVLYIFLSPEMRRRMFVLPFKRAVNRCRGYKYDQQLRTSKINPEVDNTQNALSTHRESGATYLSFEAEYF